MNETTIAYCGLICDFCYPGGGCSCKTDNHCGKRLSEDGCYQYRCCTAKGINGCWECPDSPCGIDMLAPGKIKMRAFVRCMKEEGVARFILYQSGGAMQTGDIIKFGKYEWRVLDIKDNAALIITEDMVELRAFHNKSGDITWANCEMRDYLNGEFLNIFTEEDQLKILPTKVVNSDNPWFDTIGGDDTIDQIFLLSIEEAVCKYFGDSSANLRIPNGKYKYWFTRKDINNEKRKSTYLGHTWWWWWLRSPGRKQTKAVYIHGDGNIGIQGNNALKCNLSGVYHPANNDVRGGVRPALWMKL